MGKVARGQVHYDVAIVGGGIAGLNAALILGRCLRRVVIFDSGKPRNAASRGLHGYLSRDGIDPLQLRELGRKELAHYETVEARDLEVISAGRHAAGFEVRASDGNPIVARALLLATGRIDLVPEHPGFRELYGRGIYHCPICDGWEHRDSALVAFGRGEEAADLALALLRWSPRVTLCTDGPAEIDASLRARLKQYAVGIRETRVAAAIAGAKGELGALRFADGGTLRCQALFFRSACPQQSMLAKNLGGTLDDSGAVACTGPAAIGVPGLFVAGNVRCGLHLAITAAAEGAEAAIAINDLLQERETAQARVSSRAFRDGDRKPG